MNQQNQRNGSQSATIVSDSIKRSVFGVFSENYKLYKKLPGRREDDDEISEKILKNYFISSNILSDVERCLLYFNLPFDIIKEEIEPKRLFG